MSKRRGRDGRAIPTVDIASEYQEVERRAYHQKLRTERVKEQVVEELLKEAAPRLREKGWKVT